MKRRPSSKEKSVSCKYTKLKQHDNQYVYKIKEVYKNITGRIVNNNPQNIMGIKFIFIV